MSKRHVVALAAMCVGLATLAVLGGIAGRGFAATNAGGLATASTTFTDPAGDRTGTAPDVTAVVIGDNPSNGTITLAVTAVGWTAATGDVMVKAYLDTDRNPITGSVAQGGADYQVGTDRTGGETEWFVERYDTATGKYVLVPQTPTLSFSQSGDVLTWTLNKSDIGGSAAFNFVVWSSAWNGDEQTGEDVAPDSGAWTYTLSTLPPPTTTTTTPVVVKPMIGAPRLTPAKAIAGRRLTVVFPVRRSDNGAPLTSGTMICDPSVAGKVLPHSEGFTAGNAKLSFLIPRSAKGKVLKVKVTIRSGTQSSTRIAALAVR